MRVSELLPLPRRNHAGEGLTENQLWAVDDFDAADSATPPAVILDPFSLTPTQDEISRDNLRKLLIANARGVTLPPIRSCASVRSFAFWTAIIAHASLRCSAGLCWRLCLTSVTSARMKACKP